MNILIIYCHPEPVTQSFSGSVLERFNAGAQEAGHVCEIADLYRESFNPIVTARDLDQAGSLRMPEDVRREQLRIERSDALCFVFPLWWYGMPAMLKGWIERVWTGEFSDSWGSQNAGCAVGVRSSTALMTLGTNQHRLEKWDDDTYLDIVLKNGVLELCGIKPDEAHYLVDSAAFNNDPLIGHLEKARQVGLNLVGTDSLSHEQLPRADQSLGANLV